jgi:transcriptional regulator with XRE-family HTH domain
MLIRLGSFFILFNLKIKLKFAVALSLLYEKRGYNSLRDFASGAGLESAHVQRLAAGKVDAALTTLISLAEGLGISFTALAKQYENVTEKDIEAYLEKKEKAKRTKSKD